MPKLKKYIFIFAPIAALNVFMVLMAPTRDELEALQAARATKRQPQNLAPAAGTAPVLGMQAISAEPIFAADQFLRRYPGSWAFAVDKDRLQMISGATILGAARDEQQRKNLASSLAPLFKATIEQLAPASVELSKTEQVATYRYDQVLNGVAVVDSGLVLFARPSDGAVYAIRNELKEIKQVQDQGAFTAEQAADALKTAIAGAEPEGSVEKAFRVNSEGLAQLCWRVGYVKASEHHLAFVSVEQGQVLADILAPAHLPAKVAHASETQKGDAPPQ